MSDAKGQQHEPSMEEILASIRRIIAEDGDAAAPAAAAAADGAAPAPAPAAAPAAPPAAAAAPAAPAKPAPLEDILELTEVVEPDGPAIPTYSPGSTVRLTPRSACTRSPAMG